MSVTIDDFTAATQNLSVTDGVQESFKKAPPGSPLIGDSRLIVLRVEKPGVPALAKAATLDIGDGHLVFQSGIKVLSRIEVYYGRGSNSEEFPLHHNLSGYKKFRLHFLASDLGLNINMQVRAENNPDLALSSDKEDVHPPGDPFVVDFAFDTFVPNVGPLPDFADINEIILLIQGSGAAIGANDYVLTRIEALP